MGVTQIVSVYSGKDQLDNSLRIFSTKKIVFFTRKERLKEVLNLRREIAIKYAIPTEIKTVNPDSEDISRFFREYENPILHLIDHDYLNYYLLNASFLTGIKAYFSNGGKIKEINLGVSPRPFTE